MLRIGILVQILENGLEVALAEEREFRVRLILGGELTEQPDEEVSVLARAASSPRMRSRSAGGSSGNLSRSCCHRRESSPAFCTGQVTSVPMDSSHSAVVTAAGSYCFQSRN